MKQKLKYKPSKEWLNAMTKTINEKNINTNEYYYPIKKLQYQSANVLLRKICKTLGNIITVSFSESYPNVYNEEENYVWSCPGKITIKTYNNLKDFDKHKFRYLKYHIKNMNILYEYLVTIQFNDEKIYWYNLI